MNPYDNPKHTEFVAKGYCPQIHKSKSWCSRPAGHHGPHLSIRLLQNNRLSQDFWDDTDAYRD